jgi:Trk K+ transport system NAD-binding subunit
VTNFLDGVLEFGDHQMRLEEFVIGQDSPLAGLTLKEAKLKVAVLAVDQPGDRLFTHPTAETRLLPGTAMIVMGLDQELTRFARKVKG